MSQPIRTTAFFATGSIKFALLSSLTLFLSGCASDYSFNSNLDPDAFNEYFKAGNVTLFDNSHLPKGQFDVIGLVEGESCQDTENGMPASEEEARTLARQKAADLGATGVIIKQCLTINEPSAGCFSQTICVGQAIKQTLAD